ncbi:conserved hypothetical protein [Hyella patelloides LEGE 07179]|uniref:Right handed beta helix domain-containing protein n=1 Tax=Hyella patelloides LEGE 07179 TaxID=945734 RepID=A0A563VXD8_9CYAN|nr:right-handed parallel beta-helix repeat-containing protein [Hyella patelloides]VEP16065.1 conserved hypothetical protein [Hyella patelloides LEGE 07179]
MSNFTVSNVNDSGAGSFRKAIIGANQSSGLDEIVFDLPGTEPQTIQALSPLPDITDYVIIDGTTQSGYAGSPIIELNGANAGANANGLTLTADADGSTIRGLAINSFSGSGIVLDGSDSNEIMGNYIGTDTTGVIDLGNQGNGISLENGASDNLIGGTSGANLATNTSDAISLSSDGNLIVGNDGDGIVLSGQGTRRNQIEGNYVGTDINGTSALGNDKGISLSEKASRNTIAENLVSGNQDNGIEMSDKGTKRNQITGNYIGTDATGTNALGNENEGVKIEDGATNNIVGTGNSRDRNIISGNVGNALGLSDRGTKGNRVEGNYIGTDINGTKAIGNDAGVSIDDGSSENIIAGNLISGNIDDGIPIADEGTIDNVVVSNYIGTDVTGTKAIANGDDGLAIDDEAGRSFVVGNVISGNFSDGVEIQAAGATEILLAGNYIGTDASGTMPLGNGTDGVDIDAGASDNLVTRNAIANNGETGIEFNDEGTTNNIITSNYIGTDATGTLDFGNVEDGIFVFEGASGNIIGGTDSVDPIPDTFENNEMWSKTEKLLTENARALIGNDSLIDEGNLIRNNGGAGVLVASTETTSTSISGNSIANNGGLGIDLSNNFNTNNGVTANDSGDSDTGANNLQNTPVIDSVVSNTDGTEFLGTINSLPDTTYRIEFFSSGTADPSGFGEGQTFQGEVEVETDSDGNANFEYVADNSIPRTQVVSATATNTETSDTSEFAESLPVA